MMRLRFSASADGGRGVSGRAACGGGRGAFTLIELILVVAVIGLMAGVAGVGLARTARGTQQRQTQGALVALLAGARARALETSAPVMITLTRRGETLEFAAVDVVQRERDAGGVTGAGGTEKADGVGREGGGVGFVARRSLPAAGLTMLDGRGGEAGELRAAFDARGRPRVARWLLATGDVRDERAPLAVVWFDPVSGMPGMARATRAVALDPRRAAWIGRGDEGTSGPGAVAE